MADSIDNCFYEIPYKSTMSADLFFAALQSEDWIEYYNFKAVRLPLDYLFIRDEFFVKLYKMHKFTSGLLRLEPTTYYDWHTDDSRGVSINMLLNFEGNSHCLFTDTSSKMTGGFKELVYKPETYYLFNNQVLHSVYNFSRPRFLFSLEFEEDKDKLSFNQLRKEMLYEFS
jgi:hypothetical protein